MGVKQALPPASAVVLKKRTKDILTIGQ